MLCIDALHWCSGNFSIRGIYPAAASRITGMFMDLPLSHIVNILNDPNTLRYFDGLLNTRISTSFIPYNYIVICRAYLADAIELMMEHGVPTDLAMLKEEEDKKGTVVYHELLLFLNENLFCDLQKKQPQFRWNQTMLPSSSVHQRRLITHPFLADYHLLGLMHSEMSEGMINSYLLIYTLRFQSDRSLSDSVWDVPSSFISSRSQVYTGKTSQLARFRLLRSTGQNSSIELASFDAKLLLVPWWLII